MQATLSLKFDKKLSHNSLHVLICRQKESAHTSLTYKEEFNSGAAGLLQHCTSLVMKGHLGICFVLFACVRKGSPISPVSKIAWINYKYGKKSIFEAFVAYCLNYHSIGRFGVLTCHSEKSKGSA